MDAGLTPSLRARRAQQGVVLIIALIVLVALALAGIALVRSVDTGVIVAGNLAFKQSATNAGDQGIEAAFKWLTDNKSILDSDNLSSTSAYFANWQLNADLTGNDPARPDFPWGASSLEVAADDGAGNRVRYVIHRLCAASNVSAASTSCVKVSSTSGGGTAASGGEFGGRRGYEIGGQPGGTFNLTASAVYYRITVRIDGPRNTVSYVQALVY
jgi:type IV pilus assembly protein PilX